MDYCIEAACGSSIGKVRGNNEDNFLFDGKLLPQENQGQTPPLYLYGEFDADVCMAVFDGMGGGDFGEVASHTAAEQLKALLEAQPEQAAETFLQEAAVRLNRSVWDAQTRLGARRMGSTVAALYFRENQVYACNVGDSRIFGIRGEQLLQISRDHTDEAYMKAQGITGRAPRLTQYLGMDPGEVRIEPHITKGQLRTGDIYLICSDGLTDMLDNETICHLLTAGGTAAACAESLIAAALDHGGRDNVTVIVCHIMEQIQSWRETNEPNGSETPLARLGDLGLSWGRKLWDRVRDTAQAHRKRQD